MGATSDSEAHPLRGAGIYQIRNLINGKRYVGSSKKFGHRWSAHRRLLRLGRHHSPLLQYAWNKHGEAAFVFEVLERVDDPSRLLEREQVHLDAGTDYNASPTATGASRSVLPSTRDKLSAALKGRRPEAAIRAWREKSAATQDSASGAQAKREKPSSKQPTRAQQILKACEASERRRHLKSYNALPRVQCSDALAVLWNAVVKVSVEEMGRALRGQRLTTDMADAIRSAVGKAADVARQFGVPWYQVASLRRGGKIRAEIDFREYWTEERRQEARKQALRDYVPHTEEQLNAMREAAKAAWTPKRKRIVQQQWTAEKRHEARIRSMSAAKRTSESRVATYGQLTLW